MRGEGRAAAGGPGWLGVLPVTIKDLTDVAGVRTTHGSPLFRDRVPARSHPLVERIERMGGIVVAESDTPEFGAGGSTFNEVFGRTRNPWNTALACATRRASAAPLNAAITVAGCPAVAVPRGFDRRGRSVGLQIAAPPRRDERALAAAALFEGLTGLDRMVPIDPRGGVPSVEWDGACLLPIWGSYRAQMVTGGLEVGMQYDAVAVAATLGLAFGQPVSEPALFVGRGPGFAEEVAPSVHAGGDRPSFGSMQRLVERGLPRRALRHLAREIVDGPERAAALEHRIVPRTTLARRGEDGLLTPEESEKTERLARLYVQAARALGDPADAREFLARPHPELDGRPPLEAGLTDLGARRVEAILNGIEHGLPV